MQTAADLQKQNALIALIALDCTLLWKNTGHCTPTSYQITDLYKACDFLISKKETLEPPILIKKGFQVDTYGKSMSGVLQM